MEIIQGILRGAAALNSAVILQCSKSALKPQKDLRRQV